MLCRVSDARRGQRSSFFDWMFLVNVLLAGLTGVATEVVHAADMRAWAYPVYFLHLVVVLVLALSLPYTKLAHAFYRVLAVAGRKFEALGGPESEASRRGRASAGPPVSRACCPDTSRIGLTGARAISRPRTRRARGFSDEEISAGLLRA